MLTNKGIKTIDTMKMIFDVPILLSTDVMVKSNEINELFRIYHDINQKQVTEIFKSFPYLYCCPTRKV